jgi:ABC-type uncharacterized transport system substrate-binding protein
MSGLMRRREFITLLGGAVVWPLPARAQQPAMPMIGFLGLGSRESYAGRRLAFHAGLNETGYVEGRNVTADYRWADGQYGRLQALAEELVSRPISVIMAGSDAAALAAKAATTTIPIVFVGGGDPVKLGLAASLNRPGGNITGATVLNVEMAAKRLQVLNELVPAAKTVAVLLDPTGTGFEVQVKDLRAAADALALQIQFLHARTVDEIDGAFESLVRLRLHAVVIGPSALFNIQGRRLGALAARHSVPAIYQTREFTAAGGLMSYGGSIPDAYRQAGNYVGRILKGEKPQDLPIQQTTKIEMIINLKSAKALGLTIPLPLLGRADEVIE